MIYYQCTACPHTTLDHEMNIPRPCLLCECKAMVEGNVFVKKAYVRDPNVRFNNKMQRRQEPDAPTKVLVEKPGLGTTEETTSQD